MKNCTKCGELKPLEEYYVLNHNKDGHFNECKECTKKRVKKRREENIEYVRAYDRERGSLPHRKENVRRTYQKRISNPEGRAKEWEYARQMSKKYANKKAARSIAGNAIRDGKLIPQPCERCGTTEKIHAHHENYDYPMDVTWLCITCHGLRHKEINEERRLAAKLQKTKDQK